MSRPMRSSRRAFLAQTAALAAGWHVASSRPAWAAPSPNEKLNVGVIGPGGRGFDNLQGVGGENVVALCDADDRSAKRAFEQFPKATRYRDFRKMIETEKLDAVVVSTPDHMHAPAALWAMRRGLHCYCEKPLAHSVWETRIMAQTAKEHHLATQMGTQIHATDNYRRVVEVVQSGAIGPVTEVQVWVNKDWGGGELPIDKPEVPKELDWEQWLGPAPARSYHSAYLPANWRRWWAFGNGTLGDMGCHYIDLVFWALALRHPTTIEASGPAVHAETCPRGMKVVWEFPQRGEQPPVKMTWTDGDKTENKHDGHEFPGSGIYFKGTKGSMFADYGGYRLFPEEQYKEFKAPAPTIAASVGHHQEWINACKTGSPTLCNFDYSGALTESVLLGMVAFRAGQKLEWDGATMTVKNSEQAQGLLKQEYRAGWEM